MCKENTSAFHQTRCVRKILQRGGFLRKIWVLKIIFVEMTPQERVKIDVLGQHGPAEHACGLCFLPRYRLPCYFSVSV